MTKRTHRLKTWPKFFKHVWSGDKTFEVRLDDDRGYRTGDFLHLVEWSRPHGESGRYVIAEVTYLICGILPVGIVLPPNVVIMAIKVLQRDGPEMCPTRDGVPADDCGPCKGEACFLCGAGCWNNAERNCEHDTAERHMDRGARP